jgi:nitroreductase
MPGWSRPAAAAGRPTVDHDHSRGVGEREPAVAFLGRLDLDRPVPAEVIEECLDLAIQAPTGSNAQTWRWVVVTDPDTRAALADVYRSGWEQAYGGAGDAAASDQAADVAPRVAQERRVLSSAQYLADNMHRVPVFVIPCVLGRPAPDASTAEWAGVLGSVFPAIWSFQLSLRSRGLGSVLTTLHLYGEQKAAELLGIPDTVTQAALIPVAYTIGTDFKPASRRPVREITYWDEWKSVRS